MGKLFEAFPSLESRILAIRKMTEDDVLKQDQSPAEQYRSFDQSPDVPELT